MGKRLIASCGLVAALWSVQATGHAGPECVTYKVVFGSTTQDSLCVVNAPPPFIHRFVWNLCQGVPPAGLTICTGVDIYTP